MVNHYFTNYLTLSKLFLYQIYENTNNDQFGIGSKSVDATITGGTSITVSGFFKQGMIPQGFKIEILTALATSPSSSYNVGNIGRGGDANFVGNFSSTITSAQSIGYVERAAPEGFHAFNGDENLVIAPSATLSSGQLRITMFYTKIQ